MRSYFTLAVAVQAAYAGSVPRPVSVQTTSGLLHGTETNGLSIFKGIVRVVSLRLQQSLKEPSDLGKLQRGRFVGNHPFHLFLPRLRMQQLWARHVSNNFPSRVQLLLKNSSILLRHLKVKTFAYCHGLLFSNVWTPASAGQALPVVIWIYGGSLAFGTAWTPEYDGASLALNQNIVEVSFNYRTNVFGFPQSPDLPLAGNNLGFLDQELAFTWYQLVPQVQNNIAKFGGDPTQVTIMGQSAGALSVAAAYVRHPPGTAPFRGAIMLSGAVESKSPAPSFTSFNAMASAVGCNQSPGAARLACLKQVPASTIRTYTNGASSGTWRPSVDSVTLFSDPLQRIRNGQTSNVGFMIGNTQNDGSLFALNQNNLTTYLNTNFGNLVTADQVRALYRSGLSDNTVISELVKDFEFLCPAELWGAAAVGVGTIDVYRYTYGTVKSNSTIVPELFIGAVFADLQFFPNAGAWHSSDLFEIFGTYPSDATAAERTLSLTMQTIVANFARNPAAAPAPNWPKYVPGNTTSTLAQLAYHSNVALSDVVETVVSDSLDSPCDTLWNEFLDVRV
ncbi:Alpha/Beta hydrolase protein [Mycena galopus ATCC 62051]|nr:Alpha/Beta hydrolase protein [Mycena galopus ATCC 62051]